MATEKPAASAAKTSTRRKTTKRGPTKATALKTLGITKEDLEALQELKRAREIAAAERELAEKTEIQQEAKQATVAALEAQDEPVPADLAADVNNVTSPQGPFFVRNLRNADVGLRLERQDKGKKRFDLKPRGQRGDLQKLQNEDLDDDHLLQNIALGVVEVITAGEAKDIIEKQSKNIQAGVHPAMALLRNPKGEAYEQTQVPVVHDGSYTVAYLEKQGGEAGALPDQGRGVDWEAARRGPVNPGIGGNPAIISDGFARPDAAAQADAIARRKDLEGPAAGLGGVQVTVAPTERT